MFWIWICFKSKSICIDINRAGLKTDPCGKSCYIRFRISRKKKKLVIYIVKIKSKRLNDQMTASIYDTPLLKATVTPLMHYLFQYTHCKCDITCTIEIIDGLLRWSINKGGDFDPLTPCVLPQISPPLQNVISLDMTDMLRSSKAHQVPPNHSWYI